MKPHHIFFALIALLVSASSALAQRVKSGLRSFIIERDGAPLATLPEKLDERTVFQGVNFHDSPKDPVPQMTFTDPASKAGAQYRIFSVNTAGLKSERSAEAK